MAIESVHTAVNTANMSKLVCGECSQCCRGPGRGRLRVKPSDDYGTLDVFGDHFLPNKLNGDCAYVTDEGCSIYEKRPQVCRDYDCRVFLNHMHIPIRIRIEAEKRSK